MHWIIVFIHYDCKRISISLNLTSVLVISGAVAGRNVARVGKCSYTECDLVLPEDDVTAIVCSLCGMWMHRTCFLKTTDLSKTMKTRKGMFDVNNLSMDQLGIINASLQSDCVMIVCSRCKGNSNIRKLLNKLSSVVTKTAVKMGQYEEKLKEIETNLDDVKERIVEVATVKPTEAAWVKEDVKKSFADAAKLGVVHGIHPVTSRMIKEQIHQQRRADDRKTNVIIFNVAEEVDGKAFFLNMAEMCGLKEVTGTDDIVEVKRIGEPRSHAGDKTRPILVKINSEDKKKRLQESREVAGGDAQ